MSRAGCRYATWGWSVKSSIQKAPLRHLFSIPSRCGDIILFWKTRAGFQHIFLVLYEESECQFQFL